jgi:hypothetical protein
MKAPFPVQPELTGIAIAYRNQALIADDVLPRVPVGTQEFKWWQFNIADGFTLPDTKVGRKSAPNEVEFSATEQTSSTNDYALDDPVPQADIDNAPAGFNPISRAVEGITDLILLDREKRAADLVFTLGNYPAAQRVTLAGTDQWSDYVDAASNPVDDIKLGLDSCLVRPNIMVIGQLAWSKLNSHPKIVQAVGGTVQGAGIAKRRQVADLFELEDIYVGQSFLNTAKKGQAATYGRVWGKHCALLYRDRLANPQSGTRVTFGFTAQWGNRVAGANTDPNIGMRGGQRVRAGESLKELIVSSDAGYFIQNCVA